MIQFLPTLFLHGWLAGWLAVYLSSDPSLQIGLLEEEVQELDSVEGEEEV